MEDKGRQRLSRGLAVGGKGLKEWLGGWLITRQRHLQAQSRLETNGQLHQPHGSTGNLFLTSIISGTNHMVAWISMAILLLWCRSREHSLYTDAGAMGWRDKKVQGSSERILQTVNQESVRTERGHRLNNNNNNNNNRPIDGQLLKLFLKSKSIMLAPLGLEKEEKNEDRLEWNMPKILILVIFELQEYMFYF